MRDTFKERMGWTDRETVALIGGGHTLGRAHGNDNIVTSGFDGPWTRTPSQWNYDYFKATLDVDWEPVKSAHGNDQWWTSDRTSKYSHTRRLTADMSLAADETYRKIVIEYAHDHEKFDSEFADAWHKLVHRSTDHPHENDLEKDAGLCTHFEFLEASTTTTTTRFPTTTASVDACGAEVEEAMYRHSAWRRLKTCKCPRGSSLAGDDPACGNVGTSRYFALGALVGKKCFCSKDKKEIRFGIDGGLFGLYRAPPGPPVATCVVISTGVHQHSLMYEGLAARLVAEGFAVLGYDHRGFGQSASYPGKKRSQAVAVSEPGKPSLIQDLRDAVAKARELSTCERVVVFGHSLGGLTCGVMATSGENPADGFVLSNPSLWSPETIATFPLGDWAVKAEQEPDATLFPLDIDTTTSNKEFKDFCKSPEMSQYVEKGTPMKAAYLVSCLQALKVMNLTKYDKPSLVLRGGEDIGIHELGATANLVQHASKDAELTVLSYPGGMHDIIFEMGMQ